MLPLGYVGKGFGEERYTGFTKEEQITMMTLWCIFRSPLMLGAELTKLDPWTLTLVTNKGVLKLLADSAGARQIRRDKSEVVWFSKDTKEEAWYLALFNLSDEERSVAATAKELERESFTGLCFTELWSGDRDSSGDSVFEAAVPPHGAKLYRMEINLDIKTGLLSEYPVKDGK
jgi:hypothetical protein